MNRVLFILLGSILFITCSKEEGEGGNSVITGKIFSKIYDNSFTQLIDSLYKPEVDVYIIYGNNATYDDDYKTNWDGRYRFEYLRKGNYKIFVYSTDTSKEAGTILYPLTINVNIPGNNDKIQVEDLVIIESSDYDKGSSSITGRVFSYLYNENRTILLDSYYRPDKKIFIVYGNDPAPFDDINTQFDGTFRFENLVKGTYILYVLPNNEEDFNLLGNIHSADTINITKNNEHLVINDLIINETGDYNDGTSTISGKVYVLDWNAERTALLDNYYGADEDVFIIYYGDDFYFDDVKTFHDGSFRFNNLLKGTYIVYALSESINPAIRSLTPISDTITITENYQNATAEDLIIIK